MPSFRPVRSITLPETISEQIAAQIIDGHLKPGDRLPTEPELMDQFDVGRSTIREALKSLTIAGIIEMRRGAGTFVNKEYAGFLNDRLMWAAMLGERELRYVIEVRCALEAQTAALAAERATDEQKEELARQFVIMVDSRDPDHSAEADTAFHIGIAEASQNPLLLNLVLSIRNLIGNYIRWGYAERGYGQTDSDENITHHGPILDAIRAGEPEEARRAMLDHLDRSATWILAAAEGRKLQQ